jgi:S1-C subfamily serine protease
LTNHHVVENADTIQVTLADGRRTSASLLGVDPDTDLAVLQIAIGEVPAITMGDSNAIFVGDTVLAIGNPFGVGQTVTSGIVSALGRTQLGINTYENFIQTDAAINPGNSGGALVDVNGDLVGINTAIYSQSGGSLGIGFAIPASVASSVLQDIVEKGSVTRGWIGIEPQTLTPEMASNLDLNVNKGVLVAGVLQSGPASRAGIRPGDVMLSIDKQDIQSVRDLLNIVSALAPGATTDVAIWRNGQQLALSIKPQQRPHPHQRSR